MIHFVYPPRPYLIEPNAQVGLGLLMLATYARNLGLPVAVHNWQDGFGDTNLLRAAEDIICVTGCLADAREINRLIAAYPGRVIVGGPISCSPDIVHAKARLIVAGPGEWLIESIAGGTIPCARVLNTPPMQDFDRYPFPDRRLLGEHLGGRIFHRVAGVTPQPSTTLVTSRGCRFTCAFCESGHSKTLHEYHLSRIEMELDDIARLGIKHVRIGDDNLNATPRRRRKLIDMLALHKMKWRASLRAAPSSLQLFTRMRDAGCVELNIGLESADPAVLLRIGKRSTVSRITTAIEEAVEAGIPNVRALMMMGTPGETRDTLTLNKRWVEAHPDVTVCLTAFYPFPNTSIAFRPEEYGVRLRTTRNVNFYSWRPDGSEPDAHIDIIGGLSRQQLTAQLREFRAFLDSREQLNHG